MSKPITILVVLLAIVSCCAFGMTKVELDKCPIIEISSDTGEQIGGRVEGVGKILDRQYDKHICEILLMAHVETVSVPGENRLVLTTSTGALGEDLHKNFAPSEYGWTDWCLNLYFAQKGWVEIGDCNKAALIKFKKAHAELKSLIANIPKYVKIIENPKASNEDRAAAIVGCGRTGLDAKLAVPGIVKALKSRVLVLAASEALGRNGGESELVVPALSKCIAIAPIPVLKAPVKYGDRSLTASDQVVEYLYKSTNQIEWELCLRILGAGGTISIDVLTKLSNTVNADENAPVRQRLVREFEGNEETCVLIV